MSSLLRPFGNCPTDTPQNCDEPSKTVNNEPTTVPTQRRDDVEANQSSWKEQSQKELKPERHGVWWDDSTQPRDPQGDTWKEQTEEKKHCVHVLMIVL